MLRRVLRGVRPEERRASLVAFATLFGFIGSHAVLETTRDALFLAKVPAKQLPWMYLAIAGASLGAGRLQSMLTRRMAPRPALAASIAAAGVVTGSFWLTRGVLGSAGLYALYVWSGVLTTLVLVHFWTLLGDVFSITQAKRLYGIIGAGSVLGAIVGSGTAGALARTWPVPNLLLVSALGFVTTAALPLLFDKSSGVLVEPRGEEPGLVDDARHVARQPYTLRVAFLLIVSTMCVTVADYLFKSTVAALVPAAELGAWLGSVYFVLNLLSLGAQLGLVRWLVRRFDLSAALMVLPALLALGGVGLVAGGGLVAALCLKGADGTLRYSLHRTATELLFVPLGDESRRRTKAFLDVVGQRGGQTLASLGILGATAAAAPRALGGVLVVLAALWIAGAWDLRRFYVDLFRKHLRAGRTMLSSDFPELDVASLETLVAALDSQDDAEVLAALDVLEREGKARLVPGLILYHPSEAVVERALRLFCRADRKQVVPMLERLLEHDSSRVRAAAVAARSVLAHDARLLNLRLSMEESAEVRATIIVHLIAAGDIIGAEADERLESLVRRGSPATRIALAEAIAMRETRGLGHVLASLAGAKEAAVRVAAARAVERMHSVELVPTLVELLGDERTRSTARAALPTYGEDALAVLRRTLEDGRQEVRCEIPRAIALFEPQEAASILVAALPREKNGMVRSRVIRALEMLIAAHPEVSLDHRALGEAIDATVSRAYRYLDRTIVLVEGAAADARRATPGHALIVDMLRDKHRTFVERLFRLLGLRMPSEDFGRILRGARATQRDARASSIELLENLLDPPLRGAVVGLVDDLPDVDRLAAAATYHTRSRLDYQALLEGLLASESEALQEAAAFHLSELELAAPPEALERLASERRERETPGGAPRSDVLRAMEILRPMAEEPAAC